MSARSRTASSSWSAPGTCRTSASRPGRTAGIARSARTSASSSRSSTRTSTSGWRPSAGSSAAIRPPRWRARPTRRSRSSSAPNGPTATSTPTSRWSRRAASTGTSPGATSCTASATSSRPPSPGSARSATTGCSASRPAPPTRSSASSDPTGRLGDRRSPGDRDGARRAVPGDRASDGTSSWRRASSRRAARACSGSGRFGRAYWQDHARVRDAPTVAGHAVRQLYLDCGAVDVATEIGDRQLLDAVDATLARHGRDPDVPDRGPRQPPPRRGVRRPVRAAARPRLRRDVRLDRQRHARLAAASSRRATPIAPTSSSGRSTTACCPGVSFDGTRFFYVNTLQRRTDRVAGDAGDGGRAPWFACACCPPNVMRLLSSWPQYLATADERRGPAPPVRDRRAPLRRSAVTTVRLATETGYPWDGGVRVTVLEAPADALDPVAAGARLVSNGQHPGSGRRRRAARRPASAGSTTGVSGGAATRVTLMLDMPVRVTSPDPRVDASRGCVALERGPLVYCIETADLPDGLALEEVELDAWRQRRSRSLDPDVGPRRRRPCRSRVAARRRTRRGRGRPVPGLGQSDGRGDAGLDPAGVVVGRSSMTTVTRATAHDRPVEGQTVIGRPGGRPD